LKTREELKADITILADNLATAEHARDGARSLCLSLSDQLDIAKTAEANAVTRIQEAENAIGWWGVEFLEATRAELGYSQPVEAQPEAVQENIYRTTLNIPVPEGAKHPPPAAPNPAVARVEEMVSEWTRP
jgi:hypothetical protein